VGSSSDEFLPNLAQTFSNMSVHLDNLSRHEDALSANEEAVAAYRGLAESQPEAFLPDLADSLSDLSNRLNDLGRREEMKQRFADVLGDQRGNAWARGVLFLVRARWHRSESELREAIRDAVEALTQLSLENDPRRRGQARALLRSMRTDDPASFDAAWSSTLNQDEPQWLRHPQSDQALTSVLVEWISMATWAESQAALAAQAQAILNDASEAALEHLIDANPDRPELVQHLILHLEILQNARRDGIDAAYRALQAGLRRQALFETIVAWIQVSTWEQDRAFLQKRAKDLVTEEAENALEELVETNLAHNELLIHLGLLGLCRLKGIEAAYTTLDQLRASGHAPPTGADSNPALRLATARLRAGLRPQDSQTALEHAVAAAIAGRQDEAGRAVVRFSEGAPTWERTAARKRLAMIATTRSDLEGPMARLRGLITGNLL